GGRGGAVIGRLGERRAARPVAVALALAPAARARHVARAIGGGEPPDTTAVAGPAARVCRGVRLLRVRGAARVLEVVDAVRLHVGVVDSPEVDPNVRVLVAEQRGEADVALAVERAPLIRRR